MHILVGALVGGALFAISYAITAKLKGGSLSWKGAAAAFAGGVVSGALAATTLGASLLAEGGATAVAAVAADGAAGSATEQLANNALDHDPLMKNVAKQAAWGAATAPLFYGVFKGASKLIPEADVLASKPVVADAEGAVPKVIRGEGGRFVRNPDWKPAAPEAPKTIGARARDMAAAAVPSLKHAPHHAKAASGLAASGVVATALEKLKSALGLDKSSKVAATPPVTTPKPPVTQPVPPVRAGNGGVQVTVPPGSTVTVTVPGGNGATAGSTLTTQPTAGLPLPVLHGHVLPIVIPLHPVTTTPPAGPSAPPVVIPTNHAPTMLHIIRLQPPSTGMTTAINHANGTP